MQRLAHTHRDRYERSWCPTVLAEWNGLYAGSPRGIDSVAAADRAGYSPPTALWVHAPPSLRHVCLHACLSVNAFLSAYVHL